MNRVFAVCVLLIPFVCANQGAIEECKCGNTGELYYDLKYLYWNSTNSHVNLLTNAMFFPPYFPAAGYNVCVPTRENYEQYDFGSHPAATYSYPCLVLDPQAIDDAFAKDTIVTFGWDYCTCKIEAVPKGKHLVAIEINVRGWRTHNLDSTVELSGCSVTTVTSDVPLVVGAKFSQSIVLDSGQICSH